MATVKGFPEAPESAAREHVSLERRLDKLATEVESLRRQNRRLRRLVLSGLVVASLFGMAPGLLAQVRKPAVTAPGKFGVIEAERLVIKDKAGQVRATLGSEAGKLAGLKLFGNGFAGAEYLILDDGSPSITLNQPKGKAQLIIVGTGLEMYDAKGSCRVQFGLGSSDGSPNLSFHHEKLATRFQVGILSNGIPYLDFFDVKDNILPMIDKAGRPMVVKP